MRYINPRFTLHYITHQGDRWFTVGGPQGWNMLHTLLCLVYSLYTL